MLTHSHNYGIDIRGEHQCRRVRYIYLIEDALNIASLLSLVVLLYQFDIRRAKALNIAPQQCERSVA